MTEGTKKTGLGRSKPTSAETPAEKKEAPKPVSKSSGYVIAVGKAITSKGRIFSPGEAITADDVADLEALLKGGFVVKA